MAKAKARGLDEALNELFANYEKSLTEAMKYAAQKAKDDIEWKAKSCLYEYYENYEPSIYERTDSLIESFVPYMNVTRVGLEIIADVGMGYDFSRLEGVYSGSKKYTPVDGRWVLENYLNGIHPATDGDWIPGRARYIPFYDSVSPNVKMKEYLEKYNETFNNNVLISFAKQIKGR